MFRAMFSPIISSTWLYLQYLVVFTQVAAGWCLEEKPAGSNCKSTGDLGEGMSDETLYYYHENNQQDALYRLIYYSKSALHASGDIFAYHQEHLTVFTVSGSVHPSCCRLPAGSNLGEHYQIL